MSELLFNPFLQFDFMRDALLACAIICFAAIPVGVFMTLKRMSLSADAIAHSLLPGIAISYLIFGFSLLFMSLGALLSGLIMMLLSGITTRHTHLKEEMNIAIFYLLSLALGIVILSRYAKQVDLFHILFGSILAVEQTTLLLLSALSIISIIALLLIYRPLVMDCISPALLQTKKSYSAFAYYVFLILLVINLVTGIYALGTLMTIGMMVLPSAAARFWTTTLKLMIMVAVLVGLNACYIGLLLSYYYDLATGPAVILVLGVMYFLSVLFGTNQGFIYRYRHKTHLTG